MCVLLCRRVYIPLLASPTTLFLIYTPHFYASRYRFHYWTNVFTVVPVLVTSYLHVILGDRELQLGNHTKTCPCSLHMSNHLAPESMAIFVPNKLLYRSLYKQISRLRTTRDVFAQVVGLTGKRLTRGSPILFVIPVTFILFTKHISRY